LTLKRTGILGGTFDPVHYGHIRLAEDAAEMAGLDTVKLVPARIQPFKADQDVTADDDRLAMLRIACEENEILSVSTIELDEPRISYTYLTLKEIKTLLDNDDKIFFITGTDSFIEMENWYRGPDILREFDVIVGIRPGYREEEVYKAAERYESMHGAGITVLQNRRLDISSTEIRKLLSEGGSTEGLIPEGVRKYIDEHGLY
jgi:nicotinate-nucleotide adenylyltransferase